MLTEAAIVQGMAPAVLVRMSLEQPFQSPVEAFHSAHPESCSLKQKAGEGSNSSMALK